MRPLILAAVLAAAPAIAAPDTDRLLSGVPDGRAEHCIRPQDIRTQTIVNQSTIVFERGRGRYFRNDVGSCAALQPDRAIIAHDHAVGFCEGDVFEVFDPASRVNYGACTFGPFVPFQRPAK